jgi:hypothetical protein
MAGSHCAPSADAQDIPLPSAAHGDFVAYVEIAMR